MPQPSSQRVLTEASANGFLALNSAQAPGTNPYTVVVLGTSIAAGTGASIPANAYPAKLASYLSNSRFIGQTVTVINGGVSGDTTTQMLARLPALLAANTPAFVTIEVSVNDSRTDVSISSVQTLANIRTMIGLCRQAGALPIILTAGPVDPIWWVASGGTNFDYTSPVKAKVTNGLVRGIIRAYGIPAVPIHELMSGRVNVSYDGLHPNDTGHDIWAYALAQTVTGVVSGVTDRRTILFADTFDRPDAAGVIGTASDGGTWTLLAGTISIVSNQASGTGTTGATAVRDTLKTDHVISTVVGTKTDATKANLGLIARCTDASNYYLLDMSTSGGLNIWKNVAGTFTKLLTFTAAWAIGDDVALSVNGTHIAATVNGVEVGGVTDSAITTGTKAGLWNSTATSGPSVWASVNVTA